MRIKFYIWCKNSFFFFLHLRLNYSQKMLQLTDYLLSLLYCFEILEWFYKRCCIGIDILVNYLYRLWVTSNKLLMNFSTSLQPLRAKAAVLSRNIILVEATKAIKYIQILINPYAFRILLDMVLKTWQFVITSILFLSSFWKKNWQYYKIKGSDEGVSSMRDYIYIFLHQWDKIWHFQHFYTDSCLRVLNFNFLKFISNRCNRYTENNYFWILCILHNPSFIFDLYFSLRNE